jgi:hypothetical protein
MQPVSKTPLKAGGLIIILSRYNPENYVFYISECDNLRHICEVVEDEDSNILTEA